MTEILSPLYLGLNYSSHKGVYFLATNGGPRRELSHQFLQVSITFSQLCLCFPCSFREQPVGRGTVPRRTEKVRRQSHRGWRALAKVKADKIQKFNCKGG